MHWNLCGKSVDQLQVSEKESTTSFRFGDGDSVKSEKTVISLAKIDKKNVMIKTDVIDTDLLLLLGKSEES